MQFGKEGTISSAPGEYNQKSKAAKRKSQQLHSPGHMYPEGADSTAPSIAEPDIPSDTSIDEADNSATAPGQSTSSQHDPKSASSAKGKQTKRRLRQRAEHSAEKKYSKNLRQESSEGRPSDRLRQDKETTASGSQTDSKTKVKPDQKKLNRSKLRMEQSGEKLHEAQEKLASTAPPKKNGLLKGRIYAVGSQTWRYTHKKLYEAETENTGLEAAHRTELAAETTLRGTSRLAGRRIRSRPVRQVRRLGKRDLKVRVDFHYRTMVQEHPEMKKNALSRYWQKRKLKKKYQKQARETVRQSAKAAKKTAVTTEKLAAAVWRFVRHNPKVMLVFMLVFVRLS